ncbi:ABC transporter substrate-binding protein [Stomatohabitans albus]|uniref:peptide ABC transporter substrate-binding protein n=1 Tax=Stomatohabitans albus TaxID=3110766 RepID=UPI00300CE916
MHQSRLLSALLTSLALLASGCSVGSASSTAADSSGSAQMPSASAGSHDATGDKSIAVYACEPKSLTSTNVNEPCGQDTITFLYTPLVQIDDAFNPVFGDQYPDTAASAIETSDDLKTITITLKDGWTFHNGEPMDADSFIRAWTYGANPKNAQENLDFYRHIEGFDDVQNGSTTELSGLKAIDPRTIQVTLKTPFAPFVGSLVHTAFFPMPKAALEDLDAYNERPIGNGPFKMADSWQHDRSIDMVAFEDYKGKRPDVRRVTNRIYENTTTAYNDLLAGNLDIIEELPFELADSYETDLGDHVVVLPATTLNYLGLPVTKAPFDDKRIRQALAMAIDRKTIAKAIWRDTMAPADDYVNPRVGGYREGACTYCEYNPEEAKKLFDEAGGIDGPLEVWFNSGAGHEVWVEAVANDWKKNLGIDDVTFKTLNTSDYYQKIDSGEYTGPYRRSWSADYPSMENYLSPLMGTGSEKNNSGYSNPAFDALLEQGNGAATLEEAKQLYQQADDLALEDMPLIPVSFGKKYSGTSERISGYDLDFNGRIKITEVMVKE